MKKKLFYPFVLLLFVLPTISKAQTTAPVIYQNWKLKGESSTNYEVSARIIKCHPDSAVQLHLELFNEGGSAQTAHFNLTITNPETHEAIVREITYPLALGGLVMPLCDKNDHPALRINLPASWNFETVNFTVTILQ